MSTTNWDKFRLLMWKNWLLQIRHKVQTLFEILIPVAFSGLLVMIRSWVDPVKYPNDFIYKELRLDNFTLIDPDLVSPIPPWPNIRTEYISKKNLYLPNIAFSPANPVLKQLIDLVADAANFLVSPLEDANALQQFLIAEKSFVGVEFPASYANLVALPDQLNYSLRFPGELRMLGHNSNPLNFNWRTDFRFPMFLTGVRNRNSQFGGFPTGYFAERFVQLQHMLFEAYAQIRGFENEVPDTIFLRRFPYPSHTRDTLLLGLESVIALLILLSFIYPSINMVRFVTTEKEKQLKEAMKIMGLANWLHWTAWFVKFLSFLSISLVLMTIMVCVSWYPDTNVAVFTFSSPTTILLFLFVFGISTIMFCFMLSVFFSKANTAAAVTGLISFITFAPFTFLQQNSSNISLPVLLACCLLTNSAMGFGFQVIVRHEGNGNGLQWSNLFRPASIDESLSVGLVLVMMLIDAGIYLLVALYVEKVFPGDFGVAEPWYFPFTLKFWCNRTQEISVDDCVSSYQSSNTCEADPTDKIAGIQIKSLRKEYSNKKVAVQNLSLNMFQDQITVLLGHNGAGKTTTMSMLTGMIRPSSGTALVSGKDIIKDMTSVRGSLGLCPQHNILFDELTVREHILFYGRLKGLHKTKIDAEVQKYVKLLDLADKTNMRSSTLSGGMQRKLSVAVALCADSKVVFCDEPTSGMDPAARRALWDLLLHEKKGRTILLSTHFMDEADILGDRIAIMASGELKAVGTPFFLKKKLGVGYRLVCVKASECDPDNVTQLLQKHIAEIKMQTNIGSELSYQLPESRISHFQSMLEDLEANTEHLQLLNYGISLTTLEEVFLKVGSDYQGAVVERDDPRKLFAGSDLGKSTSTLSSIYTNDNNMDFVPELVGVKLLLNQIAAMFLKRALYNLRNWILLFLQNLIPIVFLIITVYIVRAWGNNDDLPELHLTLDQYSPTVTVLQRDVDLNPSDFLGRLIQNYRSLFDTSINTLEDIGEFSLLNRILDLSRQMQSRVDTQYIVGASMQHNNITAWFNNQPYHGAPISVNLVHNAILRTMCGTSACGINVVNKPLPFHPDTRFDMLRAGNNLGFQLAFNLGFAFAFVSAFYVIGYVKERVSKAKLLQVVSGVNMAVYWTTAFIWDYVTFVVTVFLTLLTLFAFQEEQWTQIDELGRAFLVILMSGVCFLPMVYLGSLLFSIPATGFTRMSILFIFTGTGMFTIIFTMRFEEFELVDRARVMTYIFLIFPHFALSDAISNINIVNSVRAVCEQSCENNIFCNNIEDLCAIPDLERCCTDTDYFKFGEPGISIHLLYMAVVGVLLFGLLLLIEFRLFHNLLYTIQSRLKKPKNLLFEDTTVDSDVVQERTRVNNMQLKDIKNHNLVVRKMTKFYKDFLAVNQLTVGVDKFECFGLLGINGAGKTSTFKMLIGDETISNGDAWVQGVSLKNDMKEVHKHIGYCPQFDALIDDMTGRETLKFFCLLRGLPRRHIASVSYALATELNFIKHIDKKVKEYSGGNKRKLSTAVALVGNPALVYLDEPTTGMDPGAKRHLWSVVNKIRNQGRSIVLTSHSMEECEALCTRLAIMVNGEFKCLGSVQHLKSKFSKGFLLTVKVKNHNEYYDLSEFPKDKVLRIKNHIIEQFPKAELKEEFQGLLTYHIPSIDLKWSQIFGMMELAKQSLEIEDYSIGQTSLEQVFLSFAKSQKA